VLHDIFARRFGRAPAVVADAPGRVNLVGEHTDYNEGFVLPTAIPQRTRVALAPRADDRAQVVRVARPGDVVTFAVGGERRGGTWLDYVQGVTRALADAGHRVRGFDACIASDVPIGSGLSSSAALEVSLLRALRTAFALALDDVGLALVGQRAECDFVGARVGVMDQMAASLADERTALFLDTRALTWERVPIPRDVEIVVVDSGVPHEHAAGEYNARRAECERAATLLGVPALRDVPSAAADRLAALPPPLDRRARHVVTENARVLAGVAALRGGDAVALGRLFAESHASMRDDYEVSIAAVDTLVALAVEEVHVHGARLTGGGFGGAVVALAEAGWGARAGASIVRRYADATGRRGTVLVPPAPSDRTGDEHDPRAG
jgi:galactokinase